MLQEGRQAFADGGRGSLLAYLRAAEMGYELGQTNAAVSYHYPCACTVLRRQSDMTKDV